MEEEARASLRESERNRKIDELVADVAQMKKELATTNHLLREIHRLLLNTHLADRKKEDEDEDDPTEEDKTVLRSGN